MNPRRLLALLFTSLACAQAGLAPHPELTPADVVRLQVEALANDEADQGIAITFGFASPANKRATGPLERFVTIVRAPAYRPLINHISAEYGELYRRHGQAAQVVAVTAHDGSRHVYLFQLSLQSQGEWAGCWMTDSVYLVDPAEEPGLAI